MSDISKNAEAALAARKAASRKPVLDELGKLVASRRGEVTDRQLAIIASIMSYLTKVKEMDGAMAIWLAHYRVTAETARPFYESKKWADVIKRATDAELGKSRGYKPKGGKARNVDPRKDWSIRKIHTAFGIDDDEALSLDLNSLVAETRRSAIRRLNQGVVPGSVGRPRREDRPEGNGVTVRTLQRHEKKAREAAHAALLERIAAMSRNSTISGETENSEGEDSPPDSTQPPPWIPNNDTVEFRDIGPATLTYYDEVPQNPIRPTYSCDGRPWAWMLRTEESRRLAALAKSLGLHVDGWAGSRDPSTWWSVPPGLTLTPAEAAKLENAFSAAKYGESRQDAVEDDRVKKDEARRRSAIAVDPEVRPPGVAPDDWRQMSPTVRLAAAQHAAKVAHARERAVASFQAAASDPNTCPKIVSADLWNAISEHLRPKVRKIAGRYLLYGWTPDDAVVQGVEIVARTDALIAAVKAVRPDIDPEHIEAAASPRWWMATSEAVPVVIAAIANDGCSEKRKEADDRREFLRRVRFEVFANGAARDVGERIIAEAKRMLDESPDLAERGPSAVAHLARLAVTMA